MINLQRNHNLEGSHLNTLLKQYGTVREAYDSALRILDPDADDMIEAYSVILPVKSDDIDIEGLKEALALFDANPIGVKVLVDEGKFDYTGLRQRIEELIKPKVFSIDDLINHGKTFYSKAKDDNGHYIGIAVALQEAVDQMGSEGIIASMPYLIAGKAAADKGNYLWETWFDTISEENVGIDKEGRLFRAGEPVVVFVHGGGILTPQRIRQAYREGLTEQKAAQYTDKELDNLLRGVLPSGESIELYTVEDVKKGNIPDPFGRYAVWMDFETAKATKSDRHSKSNFMKNELVIARAGTLEYLDAYFEKAKSDGTVGNWHLLKKIDYRQSQGRVLFFNYNHLGLYGGSYLDDNGRLVGVAPEALARK